MAGHIEMVDTIMDEMCDHPVESDIITRDVDPRLCVDAFREGNHDRERTIRAFNSRGVSVNFNFLLHSPGGYKDVLEEAQRLIALVHSGGGVSRAFVPRYAYSAAAFLAMSVQQLYTVKKAVFGFHSAATETPVIIPLPSPIDVAMRRPSVGLYMGQTQDARPFFASYEQWCERFLADSRPGQCRERLRSRVQTALTKPSNSRGDFSVTGEELDALGKAHAIYDRAKDAERAFFKLFKGAPMPRHSTVGDFWRIVRMSA